MELQRAKNRLPVMLRWIQVFVLATVTILCSTVTRPARSAARSDVASGMRSALEAAQASHQWRNAARPVVDLRAVEADVDGDDGDDADPLSDVADDPPVALRGVDAPRKPRHARRGTEDADTSRFAMGTGLPRGPPV